MAEPGLAPGCLTSRSVRAVVVWLLCCVQFFCPPGSSVHGIFQARILEWVAFPSSGNLSDPGIEPGSPVLQVDTLPLEPPGNRYRTYQDTEDTRRAVQAV